MSQQQEPKMGPVDLALYGVILCIHYPLKLTFATYRTSKAAVVTTVSLPRRTLNYTLSTVTSIKQGAENQVRGTIALAQNTATSATNLVQNTASSAINLVHNTASYGISLFSRAKSEANHQFETKIHQPKQQYEKALAETASSVSDYATSTATSVSEYATSTATSVKKDAEGWVRGSINFVRNVTYLTYSAAKQLTEDVNEPAALREPKNQYERSYARFQAAAFETERQTLKQEILKLTDELKRGQKNPNPDKERLKCDKQIHDLQEQLTRIHLTYTQQKQHLLAEFDKERQQYKQDLQKVGQQLTQAQLSYEHLTKQQVVGFDKERHQYQEEIQKLLQKIGTLRQKLMKYEDSNHNDDIHEADGTNEEDPYVSDAFYKIDAIKKDVHDLKKKIVEFVGTEQDKEYLNLSELLIRNVIKLDNIESKGFNVVRKRRKEALRFVQKCQDELKSKV